MSPTTGASAQKRRVFSRAKCMIRSPKTRCCESLRTMSVLLEGPTTEPRCDYQSGRYMRGPHMSVETVDRDCDLWSCVCVESVGHAPEAARSRIKRAQINDHRLRRHD